MKTFALGLFVATSLIGVWLYLQKAPSCVYPFYGSDDCQAEMAKAYEEKIEQLKIEAEALESEREDLARQYDEADQRHQEAIDTLATLLNDHVGRNEDEFRDISRDLLDLNNKFVQMRTLICRHAVAEYVEGCGMQQSAGLSGQSSD